MDAAAVILARIRLLRTEEGGRHTSIASGYRPPLRFGELYADGVIDLIDRETAEPGDECDVRISFLKEAYEYVKHFLKADQTFDVTEGSGKVGEGRIIEVKKL